MMAVGLWALGWVAMAAAEPPAAVDGFRVHAAGAGQQAGVRGVVAPGPVQVFQQAPRVRMRWGRASADVQVVTLQATSALYDQPELRIGQALAGVRLHGLRKRPSSLVLEFGTGFGDSSASWGSHSVETDRGWKVMVGRERDWTLGSVSLTTRVAVGLEEQWELWPFLSLFDAEAAVVVGVPLSADRAVWLIHEVEWQGRDYSPLGGRVLARWLPGEQQWSVDLGGQLTLGYGVGGAVVTQATRRF